MYKNKEILLASQSPRRKELLRALGIEFKTIKVDVEEVYPKTMSPWEIAGYLAELKANAYRNQLVPNQILITADTVVSIETQILGKPKSPEEAQKMLQLLSGKTHEVYTAFTICILEKYLTKTDVSKVSFDVISEKEIEYYIKNFQPFDKAGAYGIQEWIGMAKTRKIDGSYYTIMGLPTHLLYESLQDFL